MICCRLMVSKAFLRSRARVKWLGWLVMLMRIALGISAREFFPSMPHWCLRVAAMRGVMSQSIDDSTEESNVSVEDHNIMSRIDSFIRFEE